LCTERGALLICDETQTGFGRTGRFFCFEHYGILPDLISIGKSFGGGMVPIAAILCKEEYWTPFRIAPLSFGSSLGGNPLACAVGMETLAMASDPQFLADVRAKGEVVDRRLKELAKAYPHLVANVRGKGLFYGIKLHDEAVGGLLIRQLFERGVISTFALFDTTVFRIEPPLTITMAELNSGLDALGEAFAETSRYVGTLPSQAVGAPFLEMRTEHGLTAADVVAVDAYVHDYVKTTTGLREPRTGLEGKFSIYHVLSVALADGAAFPDQFTDERVADPELGRLRQKVHVHVDPEQTKDSARVVLSRSDGRTLERYVAHNLGTPDNPMSDRQLEDKFFALAAPVLGDAVAQRLVGTCWRMLEVDDISSLAAMAATPS